MVVAPHFDHFAWTVGLEELNVENRIYLFVDPRHVPFRVSDDMVRHPVRRFCLFSHVGGVPLAPTKGSESNSRSF